MDMGGVAKSESREDRQLRPCLHKLARWSCRYSTLATEYIIPHSHMVDQKPPTEPDLSLSACRRW